MDCSKQYQPSGMANMAHFNNIQLRVKTQSIQTSESYKVDVGVYTVSYNILRIISGMGGLGLEIPGIHAGRAKRKGSIDHANVVVRSSDREL